MELGREIKRRLRQVALPLLGACLTAYFVYHAVHGDRGIYAWLRINQELKAANAEAQALKDERLALERRITLLSSTSLDLDMLEERARVMLNFAHPDDLIIFLDQTRTGGG
ncbi:cell division protein FtsB [Dongia mobilis]|uniref:Cell division protein FtsB n=1 Tax=Dongia mobilis TaxID=578943 RepID=A0A4R6WVY6_9PROT|nr:septum formation initiator family protein [Dongia mobilis]TDQ81428.1 cell division protein FtsB [Dongia mobilis]